MKRDLLHEPMNDGSRLFARLPESASFGELREHVALLGVVTRYLSDEVTEVWIDFGFRSHEFTINNQFGEYWLSVSEPYCPDDVLREVVEHCRSLLDR